MAHHAAVALVTRGALPAIVVAIGLSALLAACAPATPRAPAEEPSPPEPVSAEPEPDRPDSPPPAEAEPAQRIEDAADTGEAGDSVDQHEASEAAEAAPDQGAPARETPEDETAAREEAAAAPAASEPPESRPAAAESGGAIEGRVVLSGGDADPAEAIVYFVPANRGGTGPAPAPSGAEAIVTRDKSLSPTVLTVSPGTEVRFPNEDPILHNLFSVSPGNDFDLGVYGPGESPSVRFEQAGVVNIYCNVHHDMHAHVLVVDTPWRTRADELGRFRLDGLPPGEGELFVWHRQSERWSRPVRLPAGEPVEVSLEVTRPRLPAHRDKTGQPYNRRDRDPYR
jgi:plastocyanin